MRPRIPFCGLIVSGGHSLIVDATAGGRALTTVAETRDDAMGEVFDKVGKRLDLSFPGGAAVDALAERGDANVCRFSIARCSDGSLDFSFSGLKSQAILEIEKLGHRKRILMSLVDPEGGVTVRRVEPCFNRADGALCGRTIERQRGLRGR